MIYSISAKMMETINAMSTFELCNLLGLDPNNTYTRMDIIFKGSELMFEKVVTSNIDSQDAYDEMTKPLYAAHTLCEEKHFNLPKEPME